MVVESNTPEWITIVDRLHLILQECGQVLIVVQVDLNPCGLPSEV